MARRRGRSPVKRMPSKSGPSFSSGRMRFGLFSPSPDRIATASSIVRGVAILAGSFTVFGSVVAAANIFVSLSASL